MVNGPLKEMAGLTMGWTLTPDDITERITTATTTRLVRKGESVGSVKGGSVTLLERGAEFKAGFGVGDGTADRPTIIGAFGDGPRPVVRGLRIVDKANFVVLDALHGIGLSGQGEGIFCVENRGLVISDCELERYRNGLVYQSRENDNKPNNWSSDLTIQRCMIHHNYLRSGDVTIDHSQGYYAQFVNGTYLIKENLFWHNGWINNDSTIYNHNVYSGGGCKPGVWSNNIFADGAATGMQCRGGGLVEWGLFIDNPNHMTYGLVNGDGPKVEGGIKDGSITDCVMLGGGSIATGPSSGSRGNGLQIANVQGLRIARVAMAHGGPGWAFQLAAFKDGDKYIDRVAGIADVDIFRMVIQHWNNGVDAMSGLKMGDGRSRGTVKGVAIRESQLGGNNDLKLIGFFNARTWPTLPTLSDYMASIGRPGEGKDELLGEAVKGYDPRFSARAVIAFMWKGLGWSDPVDPPVIINPPVIPIDPPVIPVDPTPIIFGATDVQA